MRIVSKLAQKTHRTPDEANYAENQANIRAKYMLFGAFTLAAILVFCPAFVLRVVEWADAYPSVRIPTTVWKAHYGTSKLPCAYDVALTPGCLGSPSNHTLWDSPFVRKDPRHVERVRAMQGREFWIGGAVPLGVLEDAYRKRANQLILGWVRATHRIWVDGKLTIISDGTAADPMMITVPMTRLAEKRPLNIAIQIFHDVGHPFPDFLYNNQHGEGFFTYMKGSAHKTWRSFMDQVRPFSLFLANLLISGMFFMLWIPAKKKQEYFYMAAYALMTSVSELRNINFMTLRMNPSDNYTISIFLKVYEGAFVMFLGFSFARLRPALFRWGIPLSLITPVVLLLTASDSPSKFYLAGFLSEWVQPALGITGVIACLIQAAYLQLQKNSGTYLPVRIKRLLYFSIAMTALSFLYWFHGQTFASFTQHVYWARFGHIGLIGVLALIVFRDYQERELLMEKAPVSEYHRRPVLPMKVSGAILVADLKSSEIFYRHRAIHNNAENIVSIWRSHFYTTIIKHGGTVLHKKGDEIIGFFDHDKCQNPALNALHAVDDMALLSRMVEDDFRSRNAYPKTNTSLLFRAAIAMGDVRPVWETMGGNREAYWEEAGSTTPFVQSSRLLEFERNVAASHENSLTIVTEELAKKIAEFDPLFATKLIVRDQLMHDKHGNEYKMAVYQSGLEIKADSKKPAKAA